MVMEKKIHHVRLRFLHKVDEDVSKNYQLLMPFTEKELESISISKEESEGLVVNEVVIKKNRLLNIFLDNLKEVMGDETKVVVDEAFEFVDNEYHDLYLRLDKDTLKLTRSGNCFHIKISVAAFPKNFESTKNKVIEIFGN